MYKQIKQLADEAVALQNKDRMDAALRKISAMCDPEVLHQLADSVTLASTSTSFPFDRQSAESLPVAPLVAKIFDAAVADAQPGDTLEIVRYGDPESSGPVVLATSTKPSKKDGAK